MPHDLSRRRLLAAVSALAGTVPFASACSQKRILSLPAAMQPTTERIDSLAAAREAYQYSYDKPNIRGLAMCASLPPSELPSLEWVTKVAAVLSELANNEAQARAVNIGSPSALVSRLTQEDGNPAAAALDTVFALAQTNEGLGAQLQDFDKQFSTISLPSSARSFREDREFARMRLAGPNPMVIRQVSERLPDDLSVTESHARAGLTEGDSLEAALAEGRLFLCSYRELLSVEPGSEPVPPQLSLRYEDDPAAWDQAYAAREAAYASMGRRKTRVAPMALFAVPPGGGELAPVAIQLLPDGTDGQRWPVFTPADGVAWLRAKSLVNTADGTMHEVGTHLGRTHMVQEAFCLAMHNCLAPAHPLHHLLAPHFKGTMLINSAADRSLVSSGKAVDQLLLPTIGGSIALTGQSLQTFDFGSAMLLRELEQRGVHDPDLITNYPYRDDGKLVWAALSRWTRDYVDIYYATDALVQSDTELQAFVRQVGQYKAQEDGRLVGGGIQGVQPVKTKAGLAELLAQIIFTGSAQHAAVNFPQSGPMLYTPNFPLAAFGKLPAPEDSLSDYINQLPSLDTARLQLVVCWLLGQVHHTELGLYDTMYFTNPVTRAALSRFQGTLADVEATIEERNRSRPHYPYLLPSQIPQSINI